MRLGNDLPPTIESRINRGFVWCKSFSIECELDYLIHSVLNMLNASNPSDNTLFERKESYSNSEKN